MTLRSHFKTVLACVQQFVAIWNIALLFLHAIKIQLLSRLSTFACFAMLI